MRLDCTVGNVFSDREGKTHSILIGIILSPVIVGLKHPSIFEPFEPLELLEPLNPLHSNL